MSPPAPLAPYFPARLYDFLSSGNGYKVRLALAHRGLPYTYVEVDLARGESRTPEFLARNPNGKIPVLELADGTHLWESGALLWWLCEGSDWMPDDRLERARVLQWMCFEQYSHEPSIAVRRARLIHPEFGGTPSERDFEVWLERGCQALAVMEDALETADFFVGGRMSIADVALYAYTHVADEGGFDLERYPAIRAWLARVKAELPDLAINERPN